MANENGHNTGGRVMGLAMGKNLSELSEPSGSGGLRVLFLPVI